MLELAGIILLVIILIFLGFCFVVRTILPEEDN